MPLYKYDQPCQLMQQQHVYLCLVDLQGPALADCCDPALPCPTLPYPALHCPALHSTMLPDDAQH